jgi:ubiquinone/menaquinone biosynthesis C-methylase UbiE
MPRILEPSFENLDHLAGLIVCPACRGPLNLNSEGVQCQTCARTFAVRDGIPDLALFDGPSGQGLENAVGLTYQHKYTNPPASAAYDHQFKRDEHKRARTRREIFILQTLLDAIGQAGGILNLPCGGGRLSQPLSAHARLLVEADISIAQTSYAREHGRYTPSSPNNFVAASAFHLPFHDHAFDVTVCARLLHHFSAAADHRRLMDELCRVTRRYLILSFNDRYSVKAALRRLRGKGSPMTMTRRNVADLAAESGFAWRKAMTVSPFGSRHTYVLLENVA